MTDNIQPVSNQLDPDIRVRARPGFNHVAHFNSASLTGDEIVAAAANFPVVFLKDEETGRFELSALLGLGAGENLFVDDKGRWLATHLPKGLSLLPFVAFPGREEPEERVQIDLGSPVLSRTQGEYLYRDGEETDFLKARREYAEAVIDGYLQVEKMVEELVNRNLMAEFLLQIEEPGQEPLVIRDLYTINVDEFSYMADADVLSFHQLGYWGPIYAIQQSVTQFRRLVQLRDRARPGRKTKLTVHLQREEAQADG